MHGKYTWALAALAWYGILILAHRTALATVGSIAGMFAPQALAWIVLGQVIAKAAPGLYMICEKTDRIIFLSK